MDQKQMNEIKAGLDAAQVLYAVYLGKLAEVDKVAEAAASAVARAQAEFKLIQADQETFVAQAKADAEQAKEELAQAQLSLREKYGVEINLFPASGGGHTRL